MSVYTVQAPAGPLGEIDMEKSVFLREGFSWGAFVFGFFWLGWQRLWLAALLWLVIVGALSGAALTYLSFGSYLVIVLALRLFLGLEGNALLRSKLARKRYRLIGVVTAEKRETAERQFFAQAETSTQASDMRPAPSQMPAPTPPHTAGVLGVFPEPEAPR